MSIYSKVTEQDLFILRKLAQQQKKQRALKFRNRLLKQTHEIKLAESLSHITKKLEESTKKLSEVINPSNSENEKNQEIVPVEAELEDSEEENIGKKIGMKAPLNSF